MRSSGRSFEEFDHPAFAELYIRTGTSGLNETELLLEGVHCASCVWLVERVPLLLPGMARAELDFRRALIRISWDPAMVRLSQIGVVLDQLGYTPHPFRGMSRDRLRRKEDRRALIRIGIAGALAANVMLVSIALYSGEFHGMEGEYNVFFRWISLLLTLPSLLGPGRVFFTGAWAALRTRTLHMDLPIALALAAGVVRGAINTVTDSGPIYLDGVSILIFLLLSGRFLQQRGQRAAMDASELLFSLTPANARIVEPDGGTRDIPASALESGAEILVQVGESFPADGTISHGLTSINSALLTGESAPISAGVGDPVHAGTINMESPVRVLVRQAGENSRLANVLRQVEESTRRRAPVVALADRLSGVFVAVVLGLATATFLFWHPRDPALAWDSAIALLVVTCPCALALATPLAVTTAIGRAARNGILIKGPDALELLARPGTMVLDKTGTLTLGDPTLLYWDGEEQLKPLILGLEAGSLHPIARAFQKAWPEVPADSPEEVRHLSGRGIEGRFRNQLVAIGSPTMILAGRGTDPVPAELRNQPLTPVMVSIDGEVVGVAGVGDPIRPDAALALRELRSRGWQLMLLSGDSPGVAQAVGAQLGFAAEEIVGGATPEIKMTMVQQLGAGRNAGDGAVVMVGDGVNDAAAMAAAQVGIGVHGGAEAALATADLYLTVSGIAPLVELVDGSARTMGVIRRNLIFALIYNLLGVFLAVTGVISPLIAAILMPLSSLTVIGTSWAGLTFPTPGRLS